MSNIPNRFKTELALYNSGIDYVVGVDEVGRGPLAGPVVAAAVIFKNELTDNNWWEQINDSKKISVKKREALYNEITANSVHGIGIATVKEIEQLNILQASLLAMHRAVESLILPRVEKNKTDKIVLLVDGRNVIPKSSYQQQAIVGGDSKVHSIAAASVVAKVYRDNLMLELATKFPVYGLEKHKGYGTKLHTQAIKKFGLSPIHRASFCSNFI